MSEFQVVLLGNFAPARQQSMLRFAEMLREGWQRRGRPAFLLQPEPRAATALPPRLQKWGAYWDQYVRFPRQIFPMATAAGWDSSKPTVFHICDHSNSIYLRGLRGRRVVVTCHDLLAVRGARGEATYCPASPTGKILQAMILSFLRRVPWVACDSRASEADFRRLTHREDDPRVVTIHLALNAPFAPVPTTEIRARLSRHQGLLDRPYILHVGSGLLRKNRATVLRAFALALPRWHGRVVFAGEPLNDGERATLRKLGLPADSVREIPNVTHDELAALYSGAHALLFPSFAEGYGWPVLEAQAGGCPVVCSNVTSIPEIAGDAALLCAPDDAQGFADAIRALDDPARRAKLIAGGKTNAAQFSEQRMFDAYLDLYQRALA